MLTPEDIKNLTKFQKTVFVTEGDLKIEFKGLESKIDKVQTSLDAVLKEKASNSQERTIVNRRIKDLENWVDKAAPKLGVKFEH